MRKKTSLILTIPEPCMQSWNEMSPAGNGRFCAHCQKKVVDLSLMSDNAVFNILNNGTGLCGRVSSAQLNRELVASAPPKRAFLPAALLASFIAAVTPGSSKAGQPVATTEQTPDTKKDKAVLMRAYEGKVVNSNTKVGIPGVTVVLKDSSIIGASTDANGNFRINIPAKFFKSGFTLSVHCIGYETTELRLDDTFIPEFVTIDLYQATVGLSEVEIAASGVKHIQSYVGALMVQSGHKPFFHWLKHPFRKCR
ncbi:carboxypeptidase-like regulatory domain-containing protein [Chitinophaga agrisoli]|uniref:Carboxypeptidase-like regulatory domain-containing protein n=1 Tax=Chitinophaga agrisoli TaxID=2607653 RepID=A0A5B2W2Y4_9BACT|nr:carboxypeptidase-like regulatory domain-containing protein [Chitinophaga agrisoli]KAA2245464.1 carboxypeptidase-like regulatory domain-containing protein [Chitinophaga agrisoli]